MKTHYFLACLFLLVVGQVSAVQLSPTVRFNETMQAGSQTSFPISFTPEVSEMNVTFESITVTGTCAPWVSLNKTSMVFTKTSSVQASIVVPSNATNGRTRCDIAFTTPSQGMIQKVIGFPITVIVKGGTEPTVEPTPVPTELPTIVATTELPTPVPTTAKPTPKVTYTPLPIWVSLAGLGLIPLIRRKKE